MGSAVYYTYCNSTDYNGTDIISLLYYKKVPIINGNTFSSTFYYVFIYILIIIFHKFCRKNLSKYILPKSWPLYK